LRKIRKAALAERDRFRSAVKRGFYLYEKLSKAKIEEQPGKHRGLRAPDQRDLAQFIFLDVAAQWEAFCVSVFALELKKLYRVGDSVAERMMSNVDGGRIQGYADPDRLVDRAEALFAASSPWVSLKNDLGAPVINYLTYAQTVRNFIAHAGIGKGRERFHDLLAALNIPKGVRKGLSAGRLLLDYKDSTGKPWFRALLDNYVVVADYVASKLR
jgi:hypothetical protein